MQKILCAESRIRFSVSRHANTERKDTNGCARNKGGQRGTLRDMDDVSVKRTYCIILHTSMSFITL